MRNPKVYDVDDFKDWSDETEACDGKCVFARPMAYPGFSFIRNIVTAWRVFTGRYDAVEWHKQ